MNLIPRRTNGSITRACGLVMIAALCLPGMLALAQTEQTEPEKTAFGTQDDATAEGAGATAASAPTHRPLRLNEVLETPLAPTDPQVFNGYPDAPLFSVVPRKDELTFYPCEQCHAALPPNPTPRKLVAAPHPAALDHGEGRMWCTDCHALEDRNHLRTINDAPVDFNESWQVCSQCHANRTEDWAYGAHGKRVGNWQGNRELYSCTHCHDPHSPTLKPRAPSSPPPVRAGLLPMRHVVHDPLERWEVSPNAESDRSDSAQSNSAQSNLEQTSTELANPLSDAHREAKK